MALTRNWSIVLRTLTVCSLVLLCVLFWVEYQMFTGSLFIPETELAVDSIGPAIVFLE